MRDSVHWKSDVEHESQAVPGVRFRLRRISFASRLDLLKRVRELAGRLEFLQAGQSITDKLDGAILAAEIDRLYLEWGLLDVTGLAIDDAGEGAVHRIERGPEALVREVVAAIRAECQLSENERKN